MNMGRRIGRTHLQFVDRGRPLPPKPVDLRKQQVLLVYATSRVEKSEQSSTNQSINQGAANLVVAAGTHPPTRPPTWVCGEEIHGECDAVGCGLVA